MRFSGKIAFAGGGASVGRGKGLGKNNDTLADALTPTWSSQSGDQSGFGGVVGALRAVRAKQILLKSQVSSTPELCSGVCGCLSPAVFARVQFFSGLDGPSLLFPLL